MEVVEQPPVHVLGGESFLDRRDVEGHGPYSEI
jgi:hypothetical protein